MARFANSAAVYKVAELFRGRCLIDGTSLLWPSQHVWHSQENIAALFDAFMRNLDTSGDTFYAKWERQLDSLPLAVHRIAADAITFYHLFPSNIGADRKRTDIQTVISWKLNADKPDLGFLEAAFATPIGSPGPGYLMGRPWQVAFYLDFARAVRSGEADPRDAIGCKRLADKIRARVQKAGTARHILLHLLFPDEFERIASDTQKEQIVQAFVADAAGASDPDEALKSIRAALSARYARRDFDFYQPDIESLWNPDAPLEESRDSPRPRTWIFQANPKYYDIRAAVAALKEELWPVTGYREEIRPGDRVYLWESGPEGGIVAGGDVLDRPSMRPMPEEPKKFVREISTRFTDDQLRVTIRIQEVMQPILTRGELRAHPGLAELSIFQMAQATNFPVRPSEATIIEHLISQRRTLSGPPGSLEELAERLLLGREFLSEVVRLLEAKRQVIFYGPPGTGKTFVARALAKFLAGSDGSVETVQFHASYAYEDFVEGHRPARIGGQPCFELVPGPLKRIAERARQNPQAIHALVIDELNRSNVAKVFGELYYLLEYRDEEVTLQYSPHERFTLPSNLWIIGTMNTADRSIALALRRRFYFVQFFPDQSPIKGLLRRWLERHKPELVWVAAVVDLANERLQDRHAAIGPSYFMTLNLTEDWVRIVWRHSILSYLEEQFFGDPDRLKEFDLEKLRQAAGRSPAGE